MATLVLMLKKIESVYKTKVFNSNLSSKAEIMIHESDNDDVFESIYFTIISNTQKSLTKMDGWIIDSVIDHIISISNCNPLAGSSCINLPNELDHARKGLINIQNIDNNECFKWSIVRYLNSTDRNHSKNHKS